MSFSTKDRAVPPQTWLEQLQALVKACGPNKHDQVHTLVAACIDGRIDTIGQIMEVAIRMGYHRGHVARIIKEGAGHHWRRSADGIYVNLS